MPHASFREVDHGGAKRTPATKDVFLAQGIKGALNPSMLDVVMVIPAALVPLAGAPKEARELLL